MRRRSSSWLSANPGINYEYFYWDTEGGGTVGSSWGDDDASDLGASNFTYVYAYGKKGEKVLYGPLFSNLTINLGHNTAAISLNGYIPGHARNTGKQ